MEFKESVNVGAKTFALLRVKDATISKYNVREAPSKEDREIIKTTLAQSIKEQGLQQLPVCTQEGEIFIGGRRYAAFDELGEEWMAVEIRDLLPVDQMMASWTENFHRKEPDAWNEGRLFTKMCELAQCSQRELAKKLGLEEAYLRRRIGIYEKIKAGAKARKLDTEVLKQIAEGHVPENKVEAVVDTALSQELSALETRKLIGESRAAMALLEGTTDDVAAKFKDLEGKLFKEPVDITKLAHDIRLAEGNQPALKVIELPVSYFGSDKEADIYFKKFGGFFVEKLTLWVGKVDPFLYSEQDGTTGN